MIKDANLNKILDLKRERFVKKVLVICKKRKIPVPDFDFERCEEESGDEVAHYHPDLHKICCSERRLLEMDFEQIDQVAAHEITHALVQDHGAEFEREEETSSLRGWEPPGGVTVIGGNSKKTILKPRVVSKAECSYHLCRKPRKLKKCPYCGDEYCYEHLNPFQPGLGNSLGVESGHPCPDYADVAHSVKKTRDENYKVALGKLVSGKKQKKHRKLPKYEPEFIIPEIPEHNEYDRESAVEFDEPFVRDHSDLKPAKSKIGIAAFVISLLVVLALLYFAFQNTFNSTSVVANKPIVLPSVFISFNYMFDNKARYNNKVIELEGFLGTQTRDSVTIYYLFDSSNNRIYLRSVSDSLITKLTTESKNNLYSIEGRVKLTGERIDLYVYDVKIKN